MIIASGFWEITPLEMMMMMMLMTITTTTTVTATTMTTTTTTMIAREHSESANLCQGQNP